MTKMKASANCFIISLVLLLLSFLIDILGATTNPKVNSISSNVNKNNTQAKKLSLNCQAGEQRFFSYESTTKVWSSSDHRIKLRADLRIRCLEPNNNNSDGTSNGNKSSDIDLKQLKYLAEILSLNAQTVDEKGKEVSQNDRSLLDGRLDSSYPPPSFDGALHAEPLLEEVGEAIGEAATRMRRSVSGWFSKAWSSVKDFFSNIFTSAERSQVTRNQVLNEYGIDISSQCRASTKRKASGGLPIDDSYFEDLDQPATSTKFYVSPSLDPTTRYDILDSKAPVQGSDEDENDERFLSFFNDPKPLQTNRNKRSSDSKNSKPGYEKQRIHYDKSIRMPFVFFQSARGRILEIQFASEDTDVAVRNFKRHLCDLFATNLSNGPSNNNNNNNNIGEPTLKESNESSPIGQHSTKYMLDATTNSTAIKHVLRGNPKSEDTKQLVKAIEKLEAESSKIRTTHVAASTGLKASSGSSQPDPFASSQSEARDPSVGEFSVSVLRTINTTSQLAQSPSLSILDDGEDSSVDEMQVDMKQVQQINDGRLTGTTGQLSMSLLSLSAKTTSSPADRRARTSRSGSSLNLESNELTDMIQVMTSFSVHMIPAPEKEARRIKRASDADSGPLNQTAANRTFIIKAPEDPKGLRRMLDDWQQQVSRLRMSKASLKSELSTNGDTQMKDRLEILRDQVQMRLNEEFLTNRIQRAAKSAALAMERATGANGKLVPVDLPDTQPATKSSSPLNGDLGLSLTQLILDNGATKHKGSIYTIIEEIIQLESMLDENSSSDSMSRLLRDTLKADKLRSHCKSSIISLEQLRNRQSGSKSGAAKIELKHPFGASDSAADQSMQTDSSGQPRRSAKVVTNLAQQNKLRLDQCKSILELLLQVSSRQAGDLVIDLIDECNQRLLASSKYEELGYGPMTRYYRQLRKQFIDLLASINRPSEEQLDRLVTRLQQFDKHYHAASVASTQVIKRRPIIKDDQATEFVYVSSGNSNDNNKFNKTVLREEDDFNNHDSAAAMLMAITSLASKPSISRVKRIQLVETLMYPLKNSTCSPWNGPDLDILESMSNFRASHLDDPQPIDELVNRVVHVARRCKKHEPYLLASIHAVQGQLRHRTSQRLLAEQLRATNVSCLVKSEVVLTLINTILVDSFEISNQPDSSSISDKQWPLVGFNALDDLLLEMVEIPPTKRDQLPRFEKDRRCLRHLVQVYMSKKLPSPSEPKPSNRALSTTLLATKPTLQNSRPRVLRAVKNENQFWDEAECKRWTLNMNDSSLASASFDFIDGLSTNTEAPENKSNEDKRSSLGADDDGDSMLASLAKNRFNSSKPTGNNAKPRAQKLVERESDGTMFTSTIDSMIGAGNGANGSPSNERPTLRKRHKCMATKKFGPKNVEASLKAEVVNDLIGAKDENKFLARLSLVSNFLGKRINVGRMYLWHHKRITRAHVNILGKNIWDSSQSCLDKAPHHLVYMPLFDLNLWLIKISIGIRLQSEMGFYTECSKFYYETASPKSGEENMPSDRLSANDELQVFPTISVRASGEASARLVMARAGLSLASQYGYQGNIRVSRQPDSCMSIESSHQPMNVTLSSWLQLWDSDCHFWGSRDRDQPQATRWKLAARKPTVWLDQECLAAEQDRSAKEPENTSKNSSSPLNSTLARTINP